MQDTEMKSGVILEYRGTTSEHKAHICWDCERDFGIRYAAVVRGVNTDGEFGIFWICTKCARKEEREIRSGMRAPQRRLFIAGLVIGWLAMLCVPAACTELAFWGFHLIGEPLIGWYWLYAIPAFLFGTIIMGAAKTYEPWKRSK